MEETSRLTAYLGAVEFEGKTSTKPFTQEPESVPIYDVSRHRNLIANPSILSLQDNLLTMISAARSGHKCLTAPIDPD